MNVYAYFSNMDGIAINSISESPVAVTNKLLEESMGWRFNYPDRFSRESHLKSILDSGTIQPVKLMLDESPETDNI